MNLKHLLGLHGRNFAWSVPAHGYVCRVCGAWRGPWRTVKL